MITKFLPRFSQKKMSSIRNFSDAIVPLTHQRLTGRKRFYKHVTVKSFEDGNQTYFNVLLDGRVLRTPARNALQIPSHLLAVAIAAEWDAQIDEARGIEPTSMPLFTLACTAIDQIKLDPETVIQNCLKYLPTDSLLFFTSDEDRLLLSKQNIRFLPAIRWINRRLNLNIQKTNVFVQKIAHDPNTTNAMEQVLRRMDHFNLACTQSVVMEAKSIILAYCYLGGYLSLEEAKVTSRLEEEYQAEIWGVVEGGHDMDRLNNSVALSSSLLFAKLLNSNQNIS